MLYLACTTISGVDLAQYGVSLAKDWVSVKCGTSYNVVYFEKKKKKKKLIKEHSPCIIRFLISNTVALFITASIRERGKNKAEIPEWNIIFYSNNLLQ